jgi:hypothetical protein
MKHTIRLGLLLAVVNSLISSNTATAQSAGRNMDMAANTLLVAQLDSNSG